MKLSVVIVSYQVRDYLLQTLSSLSRALRGIDAEVFVVDNHSSDDSVEIVRKTFPQVMVIASSHNLGFSKANNLAIRQSHGEYVLLLNPDTVVGESVLTDALAFMDKHERAGVAGVKMLRVDGTVAKESRRGVPSPMTAFYKMTGLCDRFPHNHKLAHYYMSYLPWDEANRIEVVSGAFCLLRRKTLDEVGLLDEDFFMYGEDIDLSYRLLKGGWQAWYLPLRILHYKGESTVKSSFRYVHVFYEAMLIFLRKHYRHLSFVISIPVKTAIYAKAITALVSMVYGRTRKSLGFVSRYREATPYYIYILRPETEQDVRDISARNGLEGCYILADDKSRPSGHVGIDIPKDRDVIAVYDTGGYSYESILRIFSDNAQLGVDMAFYHPQLKEIITQNEIFR